MKTDNIMFIFDFDGVIVDSVNALYNVYMDFLKEFGIKGNKEEFNLLNGSKISQIIQFLKGKYKINNDTDELLKIYSKKISSIYENIKLNNNVEEILDLLKRKEIKAALASSSKKNEIEAVLSRWKLNDFFELIVTGDDVEKAKPSPDIYNSVKKKYPNLEYFVVEDSENGLQAASDAGMKTIFYNPKNEFNKEAAHNINSLLQIKNIITEIELNCFTVAKADNISLKLIEHEPEINSSQREAIEKLWNDELKKRKLFNGKIVSYKSHKKESNTLHIECFITQYKYFFAQLRNPQLNLKITPIGVSGLIIDEGNNTLLAIRQNVTEYNGYYEFIPAGSIDSSKRESNNILFKEQIITEFEEETKIPKQNIKKIEPYCFIFDKNHGVYDIGSKIHIKGNLNSLLKSMNNAEYNNIRILNLSNLSNIIRQKNCVPTSIILLNNIDKNVYGK